jgi:hypothetical protein
MGHKHVDTLKEVWTALSQERVGKENVQENSWNNADVQTADVLAQGPLEGKTYACGSSAKKHTPRENQ